MQVVTAHEQALKRHQLSQKNNSSSPEQSLGAQKASLVRISNNRYQDVEKNHNNHKRKQNNQKY